MYFLVVGQIELYSGRIQLFHLFFLHSINMYELLGTNTYARYWRYIEFIAKDKADINQ